MILHFFCGKKKGIELIHSTLGCNREGSEQPVQVDYTLMVISA